MSGNIFPDPRRLHFQVTDFKDRRPRVSPEGLDDRPARRGRASWITSLLALVSVVLATTIILIAQDEPSVVAEATTTTSPLPTPSTTVPLPLTLRSVLPETEATLVAVVGQDPITLTTWPSTGRQTDRTIPVGIGPGIEFDQSGSYLAFLGARTGVDSTLYVGSPESWQPLTDHVTSFSWHAREVGRIAWTGLGLLCDGRVVPGGGIGAFTCLPDVDGEVVGFDEAGFLIHTRSGRIVRLNPEGEELSRFEGDDAEVGPDGKVLIVGPPDDAGLVAHEFFITDANLQSFAKLDWAPPAADAEYGFVAWSPDPSLPRLAFLVSGDDGNWQLQVRTLDGGTASLVDLTGRFWDVSWDSTGRYILAPGSTPEGLRVLVYDTFSGDTTYLPFTDLIQDVHLVTESVCQDAAHLAEVLAGTVSEDVNLDRPWLVRSRDAMLESWYFVSSVVETGSLAGDVATWFLVAYDGSGTDGLEPIPANDTARALIGSSGRLQPIDYGVSDWMVLDGARRSQLCVAG